MLRTSCLLGIIFIHLLYIKSNDGGGSRKAKRVDRKLKTKNMKKLLFSALLLAGLSTFTSCKKAYSCECKTTYTDGNGDGISLTQVSALDEKMKEKQATSSCKESQTQMNAVNADLNADPTGPYEDIASTCIVK